MEEITKFDAGRERVCKATFCLSHLIKCIAIILVIFLLRADDLGLSSLLKNTQTQISRDGSLLTTLTVILSTCFSPLQCFNNYTNKHIEVRDRNGDKQTMNHLVSGLTLEEVSMQLYYVFTPLYCQGKDLQVKSECMCLSHQVNLGVCVGVLPAVLKGPEGG